MENKFEITNDKLIDPQDEYLDDEYEPEIEPDYYYCNCCGFSTIVNHGSWGCPRCTAGMEPEWY